MIKASEALWGLLVSKARLRVLQDGCGVAGDIGTVQGSSRDSLVEEAGFEPLVPPEAASILLISVLVRADFSACRESSK